MQFAQNWEVELLEATKYHVETERYVKRFQAAITSTL